VLDATAAARLFRSDGHIDLNKRIHGTVSFDAFGGEIQRLKSLARGILARSGF